MKAALLREVGQPLSIENVEIAQPTSREVLIKTKAVGLCRSDLHFLDGTYPHPLPCILGHEAAGIVEAIGDDVKDVKIGDHVVTFLAPHCGSCEHCERGALTLCQDPSTKRSADDLPRLSQNGEALPTFLNISAFAEKILVHENGCVAIDKAMPFDRAALLGCAVITGSGAIIRENQVKQGDSVAVIGAGGIGLSSINAAKIAGAQTIIAIDPLPQKLELAKTMGATHCYDAKADNLAKTIVADTGGGVHHAIEAVGRTETTELAWNITRRGGQATILGMIAPGQSFSIHGPTLLQAKTIKGSLMGGSVFKEDMPVLADHYLSGKLHLDDVIAERITLEEINEGFDKLRHSENTRSVIIFE